MIFPHLHMLQKALLRRRGFAAVWHLLEWFIGSVSQKATGQDNLIYRLISEKTYLRQPQQAASARTWQNMLTRWKTKWPTYHFLLSKVIIRCNYYRTNFIIRSFILFLSGNFPELFPTLISSQEQRLSWEYAIGITDFDIFFSMLLKHRRPKLQLWDDHLAQ